LATESGIVIRVDSENAWVKTTRTSACESCAQKGACHVSADGREMEVEAINAVGAKVGDRVVLSLEAGTLLKSAFLLYVFPILMMLLGAVIGQKAASVFSFEPSAFSAIIGFTFLVIAFLIMKKKGNRLSRKKEYHPKIIRITGQTIK
jgi:sigma-E factor negative regulatory protein RseC